MYCILLVDDHMIKWPQLDHQSTKQSQETIKETKVISVVVLPEISKLTLCYYHVMYVFQSESTLYSCLDIKELLAQNWPETFGLNG